MDAATDSGPSVPPASTGTPAAAETGRPVPPRRGYLLPGAIALAVLAVIAVVIDVAGLQSHTPRVLVGGEVATVISQQIQVNQGLRSPPQVLCPSREPLRDGFVFECTLLRSGQGNERIRVTETSRAGSFHTQVLGSR